MELTRDDIQSYVYDPSAMQARILAELGNEDSTLTITNPTNPFTMLMEAAVTTAAAATQEGNRLLRMKYPSLALTSDELAQHLSDDELSNMFSVPAETELTFCISAMDLRMNGYRPNGESYVETIIPIGTEINVVGTPLTILNNISIKLYDSGATNVEQYTNNNDIAIEDLGVLNSTIITDEEGVPFIWFKTRVKQVKRYIYTPSLLPTRGFKQTFNINDRYYYSEVYVKRSDGTVFKLKKSHNEEYINPSQPTVFITVKDTFITYKIPSIYFENGSINGSLYIEIYDTKGVIYLPLNEYPGTEFSITYGDVNKSPQAATIVNNIAVLVSAPGVLDGGTNGMTPSELRESIIYNTTGDIDLPITDYQIIRSGKMLGYDIYKNEDVITHRLYVAMKDTSILETDAIRANQRLFFNTATILLKEADTNRKLTSYYDRFAIHSGAFFKEENGVVKLLDNNEYDLIKSLKGEALINRLKANKYFISPYYYVIGKDNAHITSRVYDLDVPELTNVRIIGKNVSVRPSVNIKAGGIGRVDNKTYRLAVTLIGNEDYNAISINNIKIQLAIPLNGDSYNYIDMTYNPEVDQFQCDIEHELDIDNEDLLTLTNGYSMLATKKCALSCRAKIYIYTNDTNIITDKPYLLDELYTKTNEHTVVLSKEELYLVFGKKLEYIWNNLHNVYTDRKYLTYKEDIPLTYAEDVYEINPDTGSVWWKDDSGRAIRKKLHSKDDLVYTVETDINGNPVIDEETRDSKTVQVMKHHKGDPVLDESGNPIVDVEAGILRYIDIAMLEAEFYFATAQSYKNYQDLVLKRLDNYLTIDLPNMNNKLLENTKILYRTYRSVLPVTVKLNSSVTTLNYNITPTITLYSTRSTYSTDEVNSFRDKIGILIDSYLSNTTINMVTLKTLIQRKLGTDIVGVKITGIDNRDSEIVVINNKTNRFTLGKKLAYNEFNELEVVYDITVNVEYV